MNNGMQVFDNKEFGQLDVLMIDDKPYFPATECAKTLGYAAPENAIARHCRWSLKRGLPHPQSPDKTIDVNFIPEGDLYRLIASSKLPSAEKFERWVFDEVLPSIRKHGVYATPAKIEDMLADPDTMIATLQALKSERAARTLAEAKLVEQKPKVVFADSVVSSKTSILIGELAKLLRQNGVEVGQNRLFDWMRREGWLIKKGNARNMPTQRSMEMGLMDVTERTIDNPDGSIMITRTTKITGKGQVYFINKVLEDCEIWEG